MNILNRKHAVEVIINSSIIFVPFGVMSPLIAIKEQNINAFYFLMAAAVLISIPFWLSPTARCFMLSGSRFDWYLSEIERIREECLKMSIEDRQAEVGDLDWNIHETQFAYNPKIKTCVAVLPAIDQDKRPIAFVAISDPDVSHGDFKGTDRVFKNTTGTEADFILNQYVSGKQQ